ncbi:MAG: PAS domain S-box protein [Gemmataceae bacterium]
MQHTDDALRASKARLRTILETAVDAFITIDESGMIESYNPAAERMFGYQASEVIGQNVKVLMPEPYSTEHDSYLARYRATGERRIIGIGREALGRRKDGTTFPVELAVGEAIIDGRRLFTGVLRDLTERKRAEEELRIRTEELRATTEQLWQATKLATLGELAASIAHELNNPLATVTLRVEALLGSLPAGHAHRRPLEVVLGEVERMANLVADLLAFSRRGPQQYTDVDLRDELDRTLELVATHMRKRAIDVRREYASTLPPVYADRQQVRQVFLNLLTNAADAMPNGGILVLRVTRTEPTDHLLPAAAIEVVDTGVGIPADVLPKVAEPFFTTKEEGKGTGLGLAICRRIVQDHGGALAIESEVGKGTSVRVELPIAQSGS